MFRDGSIPKRERIIVEAEPAVPGRILGDPAYLLLPLLMKELSKGGKNSSECFFFFLVNVYPRQKWLSNAHLGD